MTVNIQYLQIPESKSLNEIVTRSFLKLTRKYQFLIRADFFSS